MGGGKEVVKLLVGNKVDQPRKVQRDVADAWARSRGMLFMEASAKTKEGIAQVFNEVVQKVLENPNLLSNTRPAKPGSRNSLSASPAAPAKGGCC